MQINWKILGSAALALTLSPGQGLAQDHPLSDQVMYGIDRETSELWRYDFATSERKSVGVIADRQGNVLAGGINASAYAHGSDTTPAYSSIFAFRWDAENYKGQMLWVDVRNAEAQVGNAQLEGGPMGGATAVLKDGQWNFYAVQHEQVSPPFQITGTIANINPNNSAQMSFELVKDNGEVITRQDLLDSRSGDLDSRGSLYEGAATQIRIRPKGNGNNNTLTVTYPGQQPEVFELRNSNTYVFTGTMQVRLYNSKMLQGGNAMGHWYLEVDGSARLNDEVEVLSPHRLVHVAHQDNTATQTQIGTVTELVPLSRPYDSVASADGVVFYAGHGNELWRIDLSTEATQVETLVSSNVANPTNAELLGMDFVTDSPFAYEVSAASLHMLNAATGDSKLNVAGLGMPDLGTILFCPAARDRHNEPVSFD